MKQLRTKFMAMLAIAGVVAFSSCEPEEVEKAGPTVSVTYTGAANVAAGVEVEADVDFTASAGLAGINYTPIVDGVAGTKVFNAPSALGLSSTDTVGSFTFTYTTLAAQVGQTIGFEIEIVDAEDRTATDEFEFTVVSALRSFTAVILEAPDGDKNQDVWFSVADGQTYTSNEVIAGTNYSAKIDFGYYYGANNHASISSPAAYTIYDLGANGQQWGTKNATVIKSTSLTQAAFLELNTTAQLTSAFDAGVDQAGDINDLAVGNVFAFKTASTSTNGAKVGLALVTAITAGTDANGKITLEIITE